MGIGFNFSQYIQDNVQEGLSGVKAVNSVKIIGPDLAVLEAGSQQVMEEMAGARRHRSWRLSGPWPTNLNIQVDRVKSARYGLNSGDINSTIQAALGGAIATTVLEADRQFAVSYG